MKYNQETKEDDIFLTNHRQTSFPVIDSCQDEVFDHFLLSNPSLTDKHEDALEYHNKRITEINDSLTKQIKENIGQNSNYLKTQPDHRIDQVNDQGQYRFIDNRQFFQQKKNDPDKILLSYPNKKQTGSKMQKLIDYMNIKKHVVQFSKKLAQRFKMHKSTYLTGKTINFLNDNAVDPKHQMKYSKMSQEKLRQIASQKLDPKDIIHRGKEAFFPLKPSQVMAQIIVITNFFFCFYCYFIIALNECFKEKIASYLRLGVVLLQLLFMFFKFNTCRFVEGILVKDYLTIAIYYFKGVFIIDMVIILHYSHVLWYNENKIQFEVFSDLLIFVLPWMFKVIKSMREVQKILVDKISNKDVKFISQVLYMIFQVIILCHFLSMIMISNYKAETEYNKNQNYLLAFSQGREININKKLDIYLSTMYWALVTLTTVGYGDITPQTQREIMIMSFTVVLGTTVFAYFIGNIGALIQELGQYQQELNKHSYALNAYMDRNNISQDLQNIVLQNLDYQVKMNLHYDESQEKESMEILNPKLKEELIVATNIQIVHRCQLLNDYFSYETQRKLALNLKQIKISPGQVIYNQNDMDDPCLYFIQNGQVEVYLPGVNQPETEKPLSINKKEEGQYFGQYEFFTDFPRKYSTVSDKFSIIFKISRSQFLEIIKTNVKDFETFSMIKDQLIFNPEQSIFNEIACEICTKFDHNEDTCPSVHYISDKEKIYKQIQFKNKATQSRRRFARKNQKQNSKKLFSKHFQDINKVMLDQQMIQQSQKQDESMAQRHVQFDYSQKMMVQKEDKVGKGAQTKSHQFKTDYLQSNATIQAGHHQRDSNFVYNNCKTEDIEQIFQSRPFHNKKQSDDIEYFQQFKVSTAKKQADEIEQVQVKDFTFKKCSEDVDQLQQNKGSFAKKGQDENDFMSQFRSQNIKKYQKNYLDELGDNVYFKNNIDKQKSYQYYLPHNNLASVSFRLHKFQNLNQTIRNRILEKQKQKVRYSLYQDKYSNYYFASNFKQIQRKRKNIHDLMQNKLINGKRSSIRMSSEKSQSQH